MYNPITDMAEILSGERIKIDCVENNKIVFDIYQKLVMMDKQPLTEIISHHMSEYIETCDIELRHYPLSRLYVLVRQAGMKNEDLVDMIKYLNDRPIYRQFNIDFVNDILDSVVEGRVMYNYMVGSTNYKIFCYRFSIFYKSFENYLQSILIANSSIMNNTMDFESAQSYIDMNYNNLLKIAVEDEFEDIMDKVSVYRALKQ